MTALSSRYVGPRRNVPCSGYVSVHLFTLQLCLARYLPFSSYSRSETSCPFRRGCRTPNKKPIFLQYYLSEIHIKTLRASRDCNEKSSDVFNVFFLIITVRAMKIKRLRYITPSAYEATCKQRNMTFLCADGSVVHVVVTHTSGKPIVHSLFGLQQAALLASRLVGGQP